VCPLCKTEIDTLKIAHDEQASALIDQLLVTCPVFGCDWKVLYTLFRAKASFYKIITIINAR